MVTTEVEKQEQKQEVALTEVTRRVNYENDWIIDSGCLNHLTGDIKKLEDLEKYKGSQRYNSKLYITHVGKTIISHRFSPEQIQLQKVYHVLGIKKNVLSDVKLTTQGNYVLFGLQEVKVYCNINASGTPIMKGRKLESFYVSQQSQLIWTRLEEAKCLISGMHD